MSLVQNRLAGGCRTSKCGLDDISLFFALILGTVNDLPVFFQINQCLRGSYLFVSSGIIFFQMSSWRSDDIFSNKNAFEHPGKCESNYAARGPSE